MRNTFKGAMICTFFLFMGQHYAQTQLNNGISHEYPEEQKEVLQTMDEIKKSIKEGEIDKLIAFHAYGPKFTEFKQGEPRNGWAENEKHERDVFESVTEVVKMETKDIKVAVYHGKVANVTFHSDFHLKFDEELVVVNDQVSLLFAKTDDGEWKIVHEHHSPLKK